MKKIFTLFALTSVTITMINCSSGKSASTTDASASKSSSEAIAEVKRNYSDAQLAEGKTLMEANCQKCHKIKDPSERTVQKLERVLPSMFNKAKLTQQQGELVRAYMIAHAKAS